MRFNEVIQQISEDFDPIKRQHLDDLISQYRDATDPIGYDDDAPDPDEVIAQIRQEFGDKIADDLEQGPSSHFPRDNHSMGYDSLKHSGSPRVTKSGKVNRQDVSALKGRLQQRAGSHTEPTLPESEDRSRFIRHNIWTVMDSDEEVMQHPVEGDPFFSAKKFIRDLDDQGYEFTHVISPEGKITYLPQHDPRHLSNEGVAEASQRVDSLVTDALKIMRGSGLNDAVQALKTVLGNREYNDRRGHYNFYVKQLMDMYNQQGSLKEFAPGNGGGESGRWYTDDQMTDLVGDGWWNDLDISGDISKQEMIQDAQAWLDDQGYSVHVLNCKVNDDDMDWFIEGSFQNSNFAKKGVAEDTDEKKSFKVTYTNPKTEENKVVKIKAHNKDEVLDYCVSKGYNDVSVKEMASEGYRVVPGYDKEKYQERPGLEGPFHTKSGKVVYYDKKEGSYYDPDTDMYISYEDWNAMNEGWKDKLAAGALAATMALGAAGAHARVTPGQEQDPGINRLTGKPVATQVAPADQKPAAQAPTGFSKEYLQGVVDGKHPRPMISVEKAQQLLKQMGESVDEAAPGIIRTAAGLAAGGVAAAGVPALMAVLGPVLGIGVGAYGAYHANKFAMAGADKLWDMVVGKLGSDDSAEEFAMAHINASLKGQPTFNYNGKTFDVNATPQQAKVASAEVRKVAESSRGVAEAGFGRATGRASWDSNMPGYQGDYGGEANWGRREREDDEHHEIDRRQEQQAASGTWYITKDGKLVKDKEGQPYQFVGKAAATKAAQTMMAKPFNQGKKFMLTTKGA